MKIENNKIISFHYTLTLDSGEIIDSSDGKDPLTVLIGGNQIIPGLEKELIGLAVGDKKDVKVQPEEGYGTTVDDLIHRVEKTRLPNAADMKIGEMLRAQGENDEIFEGVVIAIDEEIISIDFNHPLAGKILNFATEIVEVRDSTEEERSHGHAH
jgi:FKBP-type peptidyl-prolyl cis-trans isomerase SlyD